MSVAIVFPPILLVFGLLVYVGRLPIYDEWILAPLVRAQAASLLRWIDVWSPQGAHRSPAPTLVLLTLARIHGWDMRLETWASLALTFATLGILIALIRADSDASNMRRALPVIAALLFGFVQSENWVWGFQFAWFLVNFCAVAVIALLRSRQRIALMTAIVCAIVASYSLIFGFGVWLAGFVLVRHRPQARLAWCAAAVATGFFFAIGYASPAHENGWATSPLQIGAFVLAYFGAPLAFYGGVWCSAAVGLALAVGSVLLSRRWRAMAKDPGPWLALGITPAVAALLDALGRGGNGLDAALALRYTTAATPAWIALTVLAFGARLGRAGRVVFGVGVVLFTCASLGGYLAGFGFIAMERAEVRALAHLAHADDEELSEYFSDPEFLRAQATALAREHLLAVPAIVQ